MSMCLVHAPAGCLVYHGPRESVLDFFEPLGFRCPERKGIADFLQEVAPPACFPCTQTVRRVLRY